MLLSSSKLLGRTMYISLVLSLTMFMPEIALSFVVVQTSPSEIFTRHLNRRRTDCSRLLHPLPLQKSWLKMTNNNNNNNSIKDIIPDIIAVESANAPEPVGPYNQAVKAGGMLYCSGQIALDPATGTLITGDGNDRDNATTKNGIKEETRQVFKNLLAVLEEAGVSPNHVVRTTVFLVDLNDFAAVNGVYAEFFEFNTVSPSRSCVQVAALPLGARVEIDCTAIL